jgi:hypothetical protein
MNIEIKDKLYKDIESYCTLNELDFNNYINDLLKKAFMEEKYGDRPFAKAVPYEKPLPANETPTPTEVEIEVKKNEETKEYEIEAKETTIPIETDIKPQISSNEIIPIDLPMKEPDKKNLEEIKSQDTVIVVLEEKDKTDEDSEPVKEKPKRRKLK